MDKVVVFSGKENHCRLVAEYVNKQMNICRDFGATVRKNPDSKNIMSPFQVVLPEECRKYNITIEKVNNCATDFYEGLLKGIKLCNELTKGKCESLL